MSNLSFVRSVGDGANRQFLLSNAGTNIGYFRTSDIHAYVDDVEVTFTINTASPHIAVLDEAPALGADVLLRREMPVTKPYADFARGNNFGHRQVNNTFVQQLYLTQEMLDGFAPDGYYLKQELNMGAHKVINMLPAELAGEAVEYSQWKDKNDEQDLRDDAQDIRINAVEAAIPSAPSYTSNFQYLAVGGETSINTNATFGYALVSINGVVQAIGTSFNILGSSLVFAEALEEGDLVFAILSIPFAQREPLEGTVDWLYTAVGGETQVDVGTSFTSIMLTLNGVVQIPTKAYSTTGSIIHLAEPLILDEELYAIITS